MQLTETQHNELRIKLTEKRFAYVNAVLSGLPVWFIAASRDISKAAVYAALTRARADVPWLADTLKETMR